MTNLPGRMVIHTKDVVRLSGISERSASRLLNRIRKFQDLPPGAFISIGDFCRFTGLKEDEVRRYIR